MKANKVYVILTLCLNRAEVYAKRLIYTLADRLLVVEEKKVGNTPAKVECKAILNTLAAREKEIKAHTLGDTLSELKCMEMFDILSDTVALNEVESLGDTQSKVNAKALDYQMADKKAEVNSTNLVTLANAKK